MERRVSSSSSTGGPPPHLEISGSEEQLQIINLALPKGWKREENIRQSGLSAGRVDVYYTSPDGKKFWTKPQLARYFGDTVDLAHFDFHTGRFTPSATAGSIKRSRLHAATVEYSKPMKTDASLMPPIRQTASIFKQPVTLVKTQNSRVKVDFKHGIQESPRQLFWEKRLQGLRASDPSGVAMSPSELPPGIIPAGPHIDSDTVLHSIATALHLATHPVTGQSGDRDAINSNPAVFINPDQPLIHEIAVNEDDIRAQEEKVSLARKKLEEALLSFYPGSIPPREEPTEDTSPVSNETNVECQSSKLGGRKGQLGSNPINIKSGFNGLSITTSSIPSVANPQKKLKLSQNQGQAQATRSERY